MTELAFSTTCPACGTPLPAAGACSRSCGARGACALVCCPSCGLAFPNPRRSRLAWHLSRWLARRARRAGRTDRTTAPQAETPQATAAPPRAGRAGAGTLAAVRTGDSVRIVALASDDRDGARQLAALGLVPGARVRVRQRHPALVVEVDETTLALDASLARQIHVEADTPDGTPAAQPPISGASPSKSSLSPARNTSP